MEAEEKQLKAKTYKLDFAVIQQESERLEALSLKEFLILFKADMPTFTPQVLQEKIRHIIETVIYQADHLVITFKGFPWVIPHPITQNPHPGISP